MPTLGIMLWSGVVIAGFGALLAYSGIPAPETAAPARWPSDCGVQRRPGSATVLVFLHPRCPCSRATLDELGRVLMRTPGEEDVVAFVYAPSSEPPAWSAGPIREQAASLPGCRVVDDLDGEESLRFGAAASGHVVAYDAGGALLFRGGVTASRGHAGDNAGANALAAALGGRSSAANSAPTFGCEIVTDPGSQCPLCEERVTP